MRIQGSAQPCDNEEYTMPCVEALLAGTLALMTGVAQAGPGGEHAGAMSAKIARNLGALADHPALSAPMRKMLTRLLPRWQPAPPCAHTPAACEPAAPAAPDRTLWLRSPATLQ